MYRDFHSLSLVDATGIDCLLNPQCFRAPVGPYSCALEAMTDFVEVEPVCVADEMEVDRARQVMLQHGVHLLFALDRQQRLSGVITAACLADLDVLAFAERSGQPRDSVPIRAVMQPMSEVKALPYEQVGRSRVGDLMLTLRAHGVRHLLVIDHGLVGLRRIRGIISASDIARLLRLGFDVLVEARSFADIERTVIHGARR